MLMPDNWLNVAIKKANRIGYSSFLHKLGLQKIAVISGSSSVFTFKQRVEGALKADKNIEVIEI